MMTGRLRCGVTSALLAFAGIFLTSCASVRPIAEADIMSAQRLWADSIVAIGRAHLAERDVAVVAEGVIDDLYGYDQGTVLFKPTKAAERQFRSSKPAAVSYFIGGGFAEDHGFALRPWSAVRFENTGTVIDRDSALAMGNYYFTDAATGAETKVEYTFGYFRGKSGELRINLHHSSLPYRPAH